LIAEIFEKKILIDGMIDTAILLSEGRKLLAEKMCHRHSIKN